MTPLNERRHTFTFHRHRIAHQNLVHGVEHDMHEILSRSSHFPMNIKVKEPLLKSPTIWRKKPALEQDFRKETKVNQRKRHHGNRINLEDVFKRRRIWKKPTRHEERPARFPR